jgi:hypothetical protein
MTSAADEPDHPNPNISPAHANAVDGEWTFGSSGFARIFGDRLVNSSLLDCAVATRWCFVYVLAQADAMGRFRCGSVAALARAANLSLEEAQNAIAELQSPDANSSTPDMEGRRLVRIPGGWQIVNYIKYRSHQSTSQIKATERQRKHRARSAEREHAPDE